VLRERFSRRDAEMRAVGMPVYRSPEPPQEGGMRAIGMTIPPEDLRRRADLRLSPEPQEILPGVWTTGEVTHRTEPEGRSPYHFVRGEADWAMDPYRDDMSLILETSRGLALLCGCCHAGLLNTLAHVERVLGRPVVGVFGGTHLISADADHLERVRQRLQGLSLRRVSPSHCTGETAFHFLLQRWARRWSARSRRGHRWTWRHWSDGQYTKGSGPCWKSSSHPMSISVWNTWSWT
jgi:Metal-dependent hydrolases of the beta-lactamase superfamily II